MQKRFLKVGMMLTLATLVAAPTFASNANHATDAKIAQQTGAAKGFVKDSTGEPVIGASVIVKGTTTGTITDFDGNFTLEGVKKGQTIVISFVGYQTQEVVYDGSSITVTLKDDTQLLQEVVVTAMGIERKAKSLSYATQKVKGDELTRNKETNLINSLQGKTAGVSITPNSSGAGGSSNIIIRGNKSAQGNNQPLIVIDGMPMSNNSKSQVDGVYGGRDGGDALSNLNPDDIASMNVLKGASAAALYGSMAANGVIVITTKKGSTGNIRADFSSNITVDQAMDVPHIQTQYGAPKTADGGFDTNSWGDKITNGVNAAKDFFRTGATYINSLSVSGGTEKLQTYASYANTATTGIMPTNSFTRHNMMLKETYKALNDKLTITASMNYIVQKTSNRPRGGQYNNPLTGVYTFPANADWSYYKNNYETYDADKMYNVQNWYRDSNNDFSQNPYWILKREQNVDTRNRTMVSGTVKYDILPGLYVQGRLNYDQSDDEFEWKMYASTAKVISGSDSNSYQLEKVTYRQFYGDAMLSYNKEFGDYSVNATVGTSFSSNLSKTLSSSISGDRYITNYFSLANGSKNGTTQSMTQKRLNAVFATAEFGWKDMLFLDVTGRNDWSSTLSFTPNGSYFYPSVGLTAVISDMVKLPEVFNVLKARASYSIVGNEMPVYITNTLNTFSNGSVNFATKTSLDYLKPEKLHSIEFGFDGAMFDNRLDWDITFYKTNNKNQYFELGVPSATGYSNYYFNAGDIQNQGFEASINWNQKLSRNLSWRTGFNVSYNDNKIKALDNRSGIDEEDRLSYVSFGSYYGTETRMYEGGAYGDLYGQMYKKHGDYIVVNADGKIQYESDKQKIGNLNAKWNVGWSNTFYYKDFSLYLLIDGRIGGNFFDWTQASLDFYGTSQNSADARNAGGVEVYNESTGAVEKIDAKSFFTQIGSINGGSGDYYAYSQTNFRLREVTFGYTFRNLIGNGRDLSLSAVARNLFFIYKDSPSDPDAAMATTAKYGAATYYALPSTRSFGINLKLSF